MYIIAGKGNERIEECGLGGNSFAARGAEKGKVCARNANLSINAQYCYYHYSKSRENRKITFSQRFGEQVLQLMLSVLYHQ